jgi:hypothetical protein
VTKCPSRAVIHNSYWELHLSNRSQKWNLSKFYF